MSAGGPGHARQSSGGGSSGHRTPTPGLNARLSAGGARPPLIQAVLAGERRDARALLEAHAASASTPDAQALYPIHYAARAGDIEMIQLLREFGAALTVATPDGLTCLHIACGAGCDVDFVRWLIDNGADVNAVESQHGQVPLHIAVHKGQLDTVYLLLERGATPVARDAQQRSPLHFLMSANPPSLQILNALLDAGADAVAPDGVGRSPIYVAAATGRAEGLQAMLVRLEEGAAPVLSHCSEGLTALHASAMAGHASCLKLLLEQHRLGHALQDARGEHPLHAAVAGSNVDCVRILLEMHALVDAKDLKGRTPLHTAVRFGNIPAVQLLLRAKANPNATDKECASPLHYAAVANDLTSCQLLLEAGARMDLVADNDSTPLIAAVTHGNVEAVQYLVQRGAAVDRCDKFGCDMLMLAAQSGRRELVEMFLSPETLAHRDRFDHSALHHAARVGNDEILQLLLAHGSDVNARCTYQSLAGWTPLHAASLAGHTACVIALLANAASVAAVDAQMRTPLHAAAAAGRVACCVCLLKAGAGINVCANAGMTAAHFAALYGHRAVLTVLIERGANVTRRSADGLTPYQMAQANNRTEIVEYFDELEAARAAGAGGKDGGRCVVS